MDLLRAFLLPLVAWAVLAGAAIANPVFPKGDGPFGLAILMPGCSGLGPPAVRAGLEAHARALRAEGYATLVVDGTGGRSICDDPAALERRERAAARTVLRLAARHAADGRIDRDRMVFLGQSFGGSVALRLAASDRFAAIIAYYPWCDPGRSGALVAPVLILAGGADRWTPPARCRGFALGPRGVAPRLLVYAGALHSFDLVGLRRQQVAAVGGPQWVGGDNAAAAASRRDFIAFLARTAPPRR